MLKGVLNVLKKTPSSLELKIINPELHTILSKQKFTESEIENFLQELKTAENINNAVRKLIPTSHSVLTDSVFEELNKDFKKLDSILVLRDFLKDSDDILEKVSIDTLPKTSEELDNLIHNNKKLKSRVEKFISLVNKHKIKLSVITLTSTSVGMYLFETAKNMSGCYKYRILPTGEYDLLCKISNCDSKNDLSINKVYCKEQPCIKGVCNNENCTNKSNDVYKYTCVELQWHDVLNIVAKQFKEDLGNFFSQLFKYIIIFIIGLFVYNITDNIELLYRIILVAVTTLITWKLLYK